MKSFSLGQEALQMPKSVIRGLLCLSVQLYLIAASSG
jgi:hypothetical protein